MIIYLIPKLLEEKTNGLSGFNSIRLPSDFRTIGSPQHGSAERDLLSGSGVKSVYPASVKATRNRASRSSPNA
jgi:hypothetical protein